MMRFKDKFFKLVVVVLLTAIPLCQLNAKDLLFDPGFITKSTIGSPGGTGNSNDSGIFNINIASGDLNLQANSGAFAINLREGVAQVMTSIQQNSDFELLVLPDTAEAKIIGSSFVNTSGWVAINQASGEKNNQANSFVFAEGIEDEILNTQPLSATTENIEFFANPLFQLKETQGGDTGLLIKEEELADHALQETLTGEQPLIDFGPLEVITHKVSVEDTVFRGTLGLVQLNQSAGSGNSSTNNFALRVKVDAKL